MDTNALKAVGEEFVEQVKAEFAQAGQELAGDLASIPEYVAERTAQLAKAVGQPGYGRSLRAEGHNLALKAASRAVDRGDAFGERIQGLAQGTLLAASKLASAAVIAAI